MTSVNDLINSAQSDLAVAPGTAELRIEPDDPPDLLVHGLAEYFGRDDDRDAIGLVVDGDFVGYVARDDIGDLLPSSGTKGLGASDGIVLPGQANWKLFELHCTTSGCVSIVLTPLYSNAEPPLCEVHATPMTRVW